MPNPPLTAAIACVLVSTPALGAALLLYFHTRTRQTFPHADIPPMSRFQRNNERLTLSLYRQVSPHSPLIRLYHALMWLAGAAFLFALLCLFVAFVR